MGSVFWGGAGGGGAEAGLSSLRMLILPHILFVFLKNVFFSKLLLFLRLAFATIPEF